MKEEVIEFPETVEEMIAAEVAKLRAMDEKEARIGAMMKQVEWLNRQIDEFRELRIKGGYSYPTVCADIRDEVWRRYQEGKEMEDE
jgi:D-serine deaminase-like pyridoxal phosphate-dependent protein